MERLAENAATPCEVSRRGCRHAARNAAFDRDAVRFRPQQTRGAAPVGCTTGHAHPAAAVPISPLSRRPDCPFLAAVQPAKLDGSLIGLVPTLVYHVAEVANVIAFFQDKETPFDVLLNGSPV